MSRSIAIAACALAAACTTVENQPAPDAIAALREDVFRCNVEPVLARDCSYLGCHGNADFPLRVYSVGKLRAGDPSTLDGRTAPLTEAEHHANFLSAAAFSFGGVDPKDNWLLLKALPAENGGYEHLGGAIFLGRNDARAVAIRAWFAGEGSCPGGTP